MWLSFGDIDTFVMGILNVTPATSFLFERMSIKTNLYSGDSVKQAIKRESYEKAIDEKHSTVLSA